MPAESVQERTNGHLHLVDAGTGAVLHGLMSMLSEVLDGLDRRLDSMEARITELAERDAERDAAPVHDAIEAAAARVIDHITGLAGELTDADERVGRIEQAVIAAVTERLDALEAAAADRAIDLGRRVTQIETGLADARADAAAITPSIDQAAGRVIERISQAEQMAAGQAEQFEARVSMQLAELDAAVAAMRAEAAALPTNLSEQLQAAIGSWRGRLRRGESDEAMKRAFEDLTAHLNDGLSRLQDAVNRAQGESLNAAQTTVAELRTMFEATENTQLDAVAALAEKLVAIHDELGRHDPADTVNGLRAHIEHELSKVRDALEEQTARTGTIATSVARQVDEVVQAASTAVTDRVARERTATDGIRRDVELLGTRIEELGKSVSAGRREVTVTAQGLPDLLRSVIQENDLAPAIEAVKDAVASANHEHQDVLRALHSSLAKRFDARARTIAETLDGLAASLEAAKSIGPSLDKVGARLEQQQPFLDQMRTDLIQIGTMVGAMPADIERRHAEAASALDQVKDALITLRKHAAALDRAVQTMRASQEGMANAFVDLRDGNGVLPQRLDQIGTAIEATRRQLGEVADTTRTVHTAVEQQQAMGSRLAELVTQVRAATRSDIERVESSIHLEVLKQHQQDQARLTQAVAGVSEVVEREAGVIAQRVSALANEVDAIRLELAGTRPDASN